MRSHIQITLKEHFRTDIIKYRDVNKISQEEMAHLLDMSVRSYISLEHGETCCSATTLIIYLFYLHPNPSEFLNELYQAVEKARVGV